MLNNMRLAAPAVDGVLVQLLTRWASAGRHTAPPAQLAHSCCLEPAGMPAHTPVLHNMCSNIQCIGRLSQSSQSLQERQEACGIIRDGTYGVSVWERHMERPRTNDVQVPNIVEPPLPKFSPFKQSDAWKSPSMVSTLSSTQAASSCTVRAAQPCPWALSGRQQRSAPPSVRACLHQ